jgi:sirohydrochlorin cobaltochelatase
VSQPSVEQLLEVEFAAGPVVTGQVLIRQLADGTLEVAHRNSAASSVVSDDTIEIAKFDDAGNYRPLKTAPNLRQGWRIIAPNLSVAIELLDAIYPGRLAVWHAWKTGQLAITSLRSTLNRQSGMYRIAARISDDQLDNLVANFCRSDRKCLRTIVWRRDEKGAVASSKLPKEKFDPIFDQTGHGERCIPLLCQEACSLLVAACREAVKR